MADSSLRDLERAVATGDSAAKAALAAAYLRAGQPLRALRALEGLPVGALEAEAWTGTLSGLRLSAKANGARQLLEFTGWFGPPGNPARYAALVGHQGLLVFDRRLGELLPPSQAPRQLLPAGTARDAVYCWRNAVLVRLGAGPDGLAAQPLPVPRGAFLLDVSPGGERLALLRDLAGDRIRCDVYTPHDGALGRTVTGDRVCFDWERDRMAWTSGGALRFASISATEPARTISLEASDLSVSHGPMEFLRDGRLLLGEPSSTLDLDRLGPPRILTRQPISAPLRLSADGEALLCRAAGRPARLPLRGSGRPQRQGEPGPEGTLRWHPHADVAAHCAVGGQTELLSFPPGRARPRRLLRFPMGLSPLDWTPDGQGLLMARRHSDDASRVEYWSCGEDV